MSSAPAFPDPDDWRWRSTLWDRRAKIQTAEGKAQRRTEPLVLCGHGASLKIEGGTLFVRNGFTHHPQTREEFRFFRGDLSLPTQIISLDGTGYLTFDVLDWLSEQGVSFTRVGWDGRVHTVLAASGYAANPHRVQWQLETRNDHQKRMAWCTDVIIRKIDGCIRTLEKAAPRSPAWEAAMKRAYADITTLELEPPQTIEALRIIEANSAAAYFRAWRGIPLKWRGLSRRPIPEDWKHAGARTSGFHVAGNRNASHPLNAILNYAYAVLESRVQINAICEGYDPTIGIMHETERGASAFVFDVMEPERSKIDRNVLDFVKKQVFHPADFIVQEKGVCRLNPQLARTIASIAVG
jgi:CRISPR-associated endonuclease Cas1